jgi:NAD-dependent DNA ligase
MHSTDYARYVEVMKIEFDANWIKPLKEKNLLQTVADFYRLKREELLAIEAVDATKIDLFFQSLETKKTIQLAKFFYAINIAYTFEAGSKILAYRFKTIENFLAAEQELNSNHPEMIDTYTCLLAPLASTSMKDCKPLIRDLMQYLNILPEENTRKLEGIVFCYVKDLSIITKIEIERNGGTIFYKQFRGGIRWQNKYGYLLMTPDPKIDYLIINKKKLINHKNLAHNLEVLDFVQHLENVGTKIISDRDFWIQFELEHPISNYFSNH